jgi:hypothetical protein
MYRVLIVEDDAVIAMPFARRFRAGLAAHVAKIFQISWVR